MTATPEQIAAINNLTAAIQQACAAWPSADGTPNEDVIVTEWTVAAATERISGPRTDEDGDDIGEYFNVHSPGMTNHARLGLHHQALNRTA